MLFSLIDGLEKIDIILASTSPRRFELLKQIGLEFRVVGSDAEESMNFDDPILGTIENARRKALAVAEHNEDALIIAADTIVVIDETVLGKPDDEQSAFDMLQLLNNKTHQVYTAFGLVYPRYEQHIFDHVSTDVTFRKLTDDEILAYINTGEPFDKAGAYAIQGQGALLVDRIDGCYYNVVGFPLTRFFTRMDEILSHVVL